MSRCLIFLLLLFIIACSSLKRNAQEAAMSLSETSATVLPLPSSAELARGQLDSVAQADIEYASPASIRKAVNHLYSHSQRTPSSTHFQLTLATRLMRLLYPLEPIDWNVPSYKEENIYLNALTQAADGTYPQTLGRGTFMDAVIPAFILISGVSIGEYADDLEIRLHKAQQINPQSVLPFYLFGLLYERQHRLSDAVTAYQAAWERDESCYPAGIHYARLALTRNNTEKAYEIAQKLYITYPQSISIQLLLAQTYIALGDLSKAETLVSAILSKDGAHKEALFLRVRVHLEKKEYLSASALLDNYAKKDKSDKTYLLLRMRVLQEWTRNRAEAQRCLEKAEQLYPQASDVLLACAEFCFETHNTINGKASEVFINTLLEQDPQNLAALSLLLKQDLASGRWQAAVERAGHLQTIAPSEEHLVYYIRACIGIGNWQEALRIVYAAYTGAEKPSDEIIALYLETLFGAKEYQRLRQVISKKLADARSSLKAVLYYYQAMLEPNNEEKLSLLRLSLLSDPRSTLTLFALYQWYFAHKDYRKAAYYVQQVLALEPENKTYLALAEKLNRLLENER